MPVKRANDENAAVPAAKKSRGAVTHTATAAMVDSILANPKSYLVSDNEEVVRKSLVDLASYARSLEQKLAESALGSAVGSSKAVVVAKPAAKSPAELEEAAEKLRKAAVSGIKKQMSWKPSCKTGSAKWSYDGICTDPEVFGALLGLGGPPTFKMKKFTAQEFQNAIGHIQGSARCVCPVVELFGSA
ncbi:hypothetical protein OH76DRAFT_960558 [Lentinus brumalis]|uniref:Uncharacterized protein n=1 Tax=Lentinus brumalis TaxID=2498619 RepID=A0A371DPH2_9APHY|nr:hypothetical protein OH76DRAFT_960558 [Polyporus brumalis]